MTIVFEPTESRQIFVGRDHEIGLFSHVLDGEGSARWLVHIPGDGGTGKTRLLEHFRSLALKNGRFLVVQNIVDFYNTTNQTAFGLLQEITAQIGGEYFDEFQQERNFFQNQFLQTEQEPDPGERQAAVNRVLEAFLADYKKLLQQGHRIAIFFDTCEEMHAVRDWVMYELVAGIAKAEREVAESETNTAQPIHMKSVLVFAGRRKLDFPAEQTLMLELASLTEKNVSEFWGSDEAVKSQLDQKTITALYKRTAGRPLYVALVFDWLKNGVGTADDLLSLKEPFNATLVSWVRRLHPLEKQALLCMALAWRRIEPELLEILLSVGTEDVQRLTDELRRFSFVKYRFAGEGIPSSIQLHDEMRDLVNNHVWKSEGEQTRAELYAQVIKWYEQKLDDPNLLSGQALPRNDRERALLAEWLFYNFQTNVTHGIELHECLFRKAIHHLDLAFCDLLNEEAMRFAKKLSDSQGDDLRFRQALTAFRRENYPRAKEIWESLYRRPNIAPKVRATILMLLVELKSYTGKPGEALQHAKEGEQLYLDLIDEAKKNNADSSEQQAELGQLYNNWGYAWRAMDNPSEAINYYEKALNHPGTRKNKARALNNLGYCYFLLRDVDKARSFVGMALNMRRELKIPYELGLSYNTMGILMEDSARTQETADLYNKAYEEFAVARSERGQALALMNLGKMERFTNDYDMALKHLEKAKAVFERLQDKENLITVLNELGCTYRERGVGDDFDIALKFLDESLQDSIALNRFSQQTDNYEDIADVYSKMAVYALRIGEEEQAAGNIHKAREAAKMVIKLSSKAGALPFGEKNKAFLMSKATRVLGDLDYLGKQYEKAFQEYLNSCELLAISILQGGSGSVFLQRRYEGAIDRLQEQLHALPDQHDQLIFTRQILAKIKKEPEKTRKSLEKLKTYMETTMQAIKYIG